MLLRDETMATQIRQTMTSSLRPALNQTASRVNGMVGDIQEQQLPQKIDETVTRAFRVDWGKQYGQQLHQSLNQALGPDIDGVTAAQNISEALTNVHCGHRKYGRGHRGAVKHSFFFEDFRSPWLYSLSSISPEE